MDYDVIWCGGGAVTERREGKKKIGAPGANADEWTNSRIPIPLADRVQMASGGIVARASCRVLTGEKHAVEVRPDGLGWAS